MEKGRFSVVWAHPSKTVHLGCHFVKCFLDVTFIRCRNLLLCLETGWRAKRETLVLLLYGMCYNGADVELFLR